MRRMNLLLYIVIAVISLVVVGSQPPDDEGRPQETLRDACQDDISIYCKGQAGTFAYACLEIYKSKLSFKCSQYLGSSVIGACDNEAMQLCPDETNVDKILTCLHEHESSLSETCLINIMNSNPVTNGWLILQQRYHQVTKTTALLSLIYLCIPMLFAAWAVYKMRSMKSIQARILSQYQEDSDSNHDLETNSRPSNHVQPEDNSSIRHDITLDVGFVDLSYWVTTTPLIPCVSSMLGSSASRKQIIHKVSGEFKHDTITAIMGPSGSGKTTLLKLLSGQLVTGEYSGSRYLNGKRTDPGTFYRVMSTQGYVAQHDTFLESLTVWQTLVYAALLRIRDNISIEDKIHRAAKVMLDMGLDSVAHSVLNSEMHSENSKGISGGQRRRLSIAQTFLGSPQVMCLDEPTSGLDASGSLRLMKILSSLSRQQHTAVALTIHQPRAEVFSLFDNLILLGTGGHMIYSGPASSAVSIMLRVSGITINIASYDNPGDFIIDVLGARSDEDEVTPRTSHHSISPTQSSIMSSAPQQLRNISQQASATVGALLNRLPSSSILSGSRLRSQGDSLGEYEMVSMDDSERDRSMSSALPQDEIDNHDKSADPHHPASIIADDASTSALIDMTPSIRMSRSADLQPELMVELNQIYLQSDEHQALIAKYPPSTPDLIIKAPSTNVSSIMSCNIWKSSLIEGNDMMLQHIIDVHIASPTPLSTQTWILFSRRIQSCWLSPKDFLVLFGQMVLIGFVVCYTFSYKASSDLELPYQVLMVIVVISSYLMILQYLSLVPEYMNERKVILTEYFTKHISITPYIISALLTEMPRAIMQSSLFYRIIYSIRPLNPYSTNRFFFLVCLMVGVCAWQSQIALCAMLTDQISYVYTLTFMVLGSGTLFGGLVLRLNKIPVIFKMFYFISVSAVTQRALVVNDMECCYLTMTCNSLAKEMKTNPIVLPPDTTHSTPSYRRLTAQSSLSSFSSFSSSIMDNIIRDKQILKYSTIALDEYPPSSSGRNFEPAPSTSTSTTNFCPPGLQFNGDGSDEGNLGRMYLKLMGLDHDFPFFSLSILFWINIIFRISAGCILRFRTQRRYQLKYVE